MADHRVAATTENDGLLQGVSAYLAQLASAAIRAVGLRRLPPRSAGGDTPLQPGLPASMAGVAQSGMLATLKQLVPDAQAPGATVRDTALPASGRLQDARSRLLRQAVQCVPQPYREVLILKMLEGLSQREIAHRLGVSTDLVATHLAAGIVYCNQYVATVNNGDTQADSRLRRRSAD